MLSRTLMSAAALHLVMRMSTVDHIGVQLEDDNSLQLEQSL
jgi:hypothetical protein